MVYPLYQYISFSIYISSSNLLVKSIYLFSLVYFKMNLPRFIHLPQLSIYMLYQSTLFYSSTLLLCVPIRHFMVYPFYQYALFCLSTSSFNLPVESIYFLPWSTAKRTYFVSLIYLISQSTYRKWGRSKKMEDQKIR